jgi:uncharacterized protein (DUF2235 family)
MKKLIVCCDGTWNTQDEKDEGHPCPTNVTKIARALLPLDSKGTLQMVHYERGVGTDLGIRVRGGALGRGLFQNVVGSYRFLVQNYEPGDRIYLFGFSRGAYTARSLAGLIRNSGILKRGHEACEDRAIEIYRDYDPDTAPDGKVSIRFRNEHAHETKIEFIGVWDTVGALGVPGLDGRFRLLKGLDWQFHDVTLSTWVKNAFHALAIHERRTEFVPTLWEQKPEAPAEQRLEQTWFSGAHSDVGGGYPEAGLSDVALKWMVRRAKDCGLEFDAAMNLNPDAEAEGHDSFGFFYKVLGWLRFKKGGTFRKFRTTPKLTTREDLHESVLRRAQAKPQEEWPETFRSEINKRLTS